MDRTRASLALLLLVATCGARLGTAASPRALLQGTSGSAPKGQPEDVAAIGEGSRGARQTVCLQQILSTLIASPSNSTARPPGPHTCKTDAGNADECLYACRHLLWSLLRLVFVLQLVS